MTPFFLKPHHDLVTKSAPIPYFRHARMTPWSSHRQKQHPAGLYLDLMITPAEPEAFREFKIRTAMRSVQHRSQTYCMVTFV